MNLVDEQDGWLAGIRQTVGGARENSAHVRDVRFHAAQSLEFVLCLAGDDVRERRLACAGRAVEDEGLNPIGLDGAAEELTGSENVGLADELIKGERPHARRQRSWGGQVRGSWSGGDWSRRRAEQVIP